MNENDGSGKAADVERTVMTTNTAGGVVHSQSCSRRAAAREPMPIPASPRTRPGGGGPAARLPWAGVDPGG